MDALQRSPDLDLGRPPSFCSPLPPFSGSSKCLSSCSFAELSFSFYQYRPLSPSTTDSARVTTAYMGVDSIQRGLGNEPPGEDLVFGLSLVASGDCLLSAGENQNKGDPTEGNRASPEL